MDGYFKKPGSIPFKWEIQPGIPKPHLQTHSTATSSQLPSKLSLPPSKTKTKTPLPSPTQSPLTHYSSPWLSELLISPAPSPSQSPAIFPRSASSSPSKRQTYRYLRSSSNSQAFSSPPEVLAISRGCFPIRSLRRRDDKKRSSGCYGGSDVVVPSPHRSGSSRSSSSFSSPFRKSLSAREEAAVAARWIF